VKQRIQKVLAAAGVASRRAIEQLVLEGRVAVNDEIVTTLPVLIDPASDRVEVDGQRVRLAERARDQQHYYVLMNKPKGVYCTNVAQGDQVRAIDLLPRDFPVRVYPVGRLDSEGQGLLLLTNDGDLTNRLTHPRFGLPKTYRAVVDGRVNQQTADELSAGVWLTDPERGAYKTGRSVIRVVKRLLKRSVLEISLSEGRDNQVRRMLAKVGHKVRQLTRVRFGPLTLHGLGDGQMRMLTSKEVRQLREATRDEAKPPAPSVHPTEAPKPRQGGRRNHHHHAQSPRSNRPPAHRARQISSRRPDKSSRHR
jgi:23S rRNA pseudouridine2605 synthase